MNQSIKRAAGIEPASSAWKAEVLPLNYARLTLQTAPACDHQALCRRTQIMVEGAGFEPAKAEPSDLQSDPFDHSGTPPELPTYWKQTNSSFEPKLELARGVEPPTG